MPPVVAGVIGIVAVIGSTFASGTIAATLLSIGVSLVLSGVSALLSKDAQQPSFSQQALDRSLMVRQPIATRKVVYGEVKVSGPIVFIHSAQSDVPGVVTVTQNEPNNSQGIDNFLHIIIALVGHEVEAIDEIYFGDDEITLDGDGFGLDSHARIKKHLGSTGQTADSLLVQEASTHWTENHRLQGIAYVYARLKSSNEHFPNGIPNVSAVVRGKKVYDPRTEATAYSNNPALCLMDYLMNTEYGLGAAITEIDIESFIAAANICEEQVPLAAGGFENRYTCNGLIDTAVAPQDNIQGLLTSLSGNLVYTAGRFYIVPGAFTYPVMNLDEDDARGSIQVITRVSRREQFNGVKGIFVSPENSYQPTDFPPVVNAFYLSEDQGERRWKDVELPFTTSSATAQRIAKIELERSRQPITVSYPAKMTAFNLKPGDTVTVTNDRFGWAAKEFVVMEWDIVPETTDGAGTLGVDLILRETASEVFDWNSGEETTFDFAPNTNLPSPFSVFPPEGVQLFGGLEEVIEVGQGVFQTRIRIEWNQHPSLSVTSGGSFEIQHRLNGDPEWSESRFVTGDRTQAFINNLVDEEFYDVRLRAVNSLGVKSAWVEIDNFQVLGLKSPPPDVQFFVIQKGVLKWTYPDDIVNLAGFRVKYQNSNYPFWATGIELHEGLVTEKEFAVVPIFGQTQTFMVKAVTQSGTESASPAVVITNLGDVETDNLILEYDLKEAGWPGTLAGGIVNGSDELESLQDCA